MSYRHPARTIPFADLRQGLVDAISAGYVHESSNGDGLGIYCYTKHCVFEKAWTPITELARGLIIDFKNERVVATPFPKFFNVGERENQSIPDIGFDTFEKIDGSLIIIFWHESQWYCATKGSFSSEQALAAARWMHKFDLSKGLLRGWTYLAEWVSPNNRIVVPYDKDELILLAVYDGAGFEQSYPYVRFVADRLGWRTAQRHTFKHVSDLIEHAKTLPMTEEGFVLRFANGLRLKVKGDEYRRIHSLISRVTPLAMWEAMLAGDDMQAIRKELPEEFWIDFDRITGLLNLKLNNLEAKATLHARNTAHLSDKSVGLHLDDFPADVRGFIFPLRKFGSLREGGSRHKLFKAIRPTANQLDGYTPSHAMNLVFEEAA